MIFPNSLLEKRNFWWIPMQCRKLLINSDGTFLTIIRGKAYYSMGVNNKEANCIIKINLFFLKLSFVDTPS